jgi:transcriptional regulator with XRE-family HTH domain
MRQKMSVRAFARAAGVSAGYVSRVVAGERWPLPRRLREWADVLELTGAERLAFILAAELEAAPKELQSHVLELRKTAARSRKKL